MTKTLYRRTPSAQITEFDNNAVVLDLSSDTYYALNATGLLVWSQLLDGRTVDEVTDTVAATYQVERTAVASDVHRMVQDLVGAGLVTPYTS